MMRRRMWNKFMAKDREDRTHEVSSMIPDAASDNRSWTEEGLRQLFKKCADVKITRFELGEPDDPQPVLLIACMGLSDARQINEYVLSKLERMQIGSALSPKLHADLAMTAFEETEEIILRVFSGQLVLYFVNQQALFALDIANPPVRMPAESSTELSIKGPRDGFIEDLDVNVALVRKRLRTNALCYEQFIVGKKSESRVALLYIEDMIQPAYVDEARKRIKHLEMEVLFGSAQLEEVLSDGSYSVFPLITYTGRPDFVVDCLIHGRLAIIVDGSPTAVIAPVNLTLLMKSPEDIYFPFQVVSFEMMIRMIGLIIALFLPGFWVAIASYNLEQIPFPLLATLVIARHGLPMPGPLEAFLMFGLFELFREAGVRLPKAVGQTIAVVGGIIVGDAVIRAGLASTTMLIVTSVTAVATYTLVNQTLSSGVTMVRLFILICAASLGMYGFVLGAIAVILHLSKLESFGVPYLAPLSPLKLKDLVGAIFKKPVRYGEEQPQFLKSEGSRQKEGGS